MMSFVLTAVASLYFSGLRVLPALWNLLVVAVAAYSLGKIVAYRNAMKELNQLSADTDKKLQELHRQVDWQLKAKGHEGLKPLEKEEGNDGAESTLDSNR